MRLAAAVVTLAAVPSLAMAQVIRSPSQRVETDHELQDPTGLVVGATEGMVVVGEEAFESLDPGFGAQLYAGSQFGPISELRAGVSFSAHADEAADESTRNLSLFLESYFATEVLA